MLDFDFEKVCSISNSHLNVYACLVCGKYFQVVAESGFGVVCRWGACEQVRRMCEHAAVLCGGWRVGGWREEVNFTRDDHGGSVEKRDRSMCLPCCFVIRNE